MIFSTQLSRTPLAAAIAVSAALALAAFGSIAHSSAASAAEPGDPDFLGTAETYVIVASDAITDADPVAPSEVHGDVALTGTANGLGTSQVVNGDIHNTDADATIARDDVNAAYVELAAAPATAPIVADLGFNPLPYLPGVYNSGSTILLNGTITLDGLSDNQAVFVFQAGSDLIVGTDAHVLLINGAQACNVYWQVGSSATIGTDAIFVGTVVAASSITVNTGATVEGRLLASALYAGSVTLDDNLINAQTRCVRVSTSGGNTTTTTSENGTTTTVVVPTLAVPPTTPPTTPVTPPVTTPTTTTPTTTRTPVRASSRDRLVNTGRLANTAATDTDSTTPLLASLSGLGVLVGAALLVIARRRSVTD